MSDEGLNRMDVIEAHMAREPDCVHSLDYGGHGAHPMSACTTCRNSPVLAEWRRYWREEGTAARPS